jgi:hypothetical protein
LGALSLVFAAVSAVAGAVAALAAWNAATEARRATQGQFVTSLRREYASPAMLADIELVKSWIAGSPITTDGELDNARRRISHHFQNIVALANAGLLAEQFLPVVVTKDEADLFCGIIQEMERQISPSYDRSAFDRLDRLYFGHPEGGSRALVR